MATRHNDARRIEAMAALGTGLSRDDHDAVESAARDDGALIFVFVLAALLRFSNLDYNGPFIDESFYTFVGANVSHLTSDYRCWPRFAEALYPLLGITGLRFVTAVFGLFAVAFLYKLAEILVLPCESGESVRRTPVFAAFLFATCAPALFISNLATPDAMAFMLFAFGFWQLARGIERNSRVALLAGAVALAVACATRYMVFMYLPAAVVYVFYASLLKARRALIPYALVPLALLVGAYGSINKDHVLQAVRHVEMMGLTTSGAPAAIILRDGLLIMGPIFPLAVYESLGRLLGRGKAAPSDLRTPHLLFLLTVTLEVPVYHALRGFNMSLEKNLVFTLFFGSILAGMACSRLLRPMNLEMNRNKVLAVAFWLVLAYPGIAATKYYQTRWTDWRPVIAGVREAIEALGLEAGVPGQIYFNADEGTLGNGHLLRADLGPIVSEESAWQHMNPEFRGLNIVEIAERKRIPVVVAVFVEDFREGDRIGNFLVGRKLALPNVSPGRRHNGVRIDQVYLLIDSRHPGRERYLLRTRESRADGP